MKANYRALLIFVLGFGIFMLTRRSMFFPTISVAIVIAPIFILRFIRTQPAGRGSLLTFVGFLLSMNIALWGLFGSSTTILVVNLIRSTLLSILYFLPYLLDRLLYPKFQKKPFLSTLIFPISLTAVFFLSSLEGPFDGTVAKTVYAYGPLVLQQLNSLTGLWGFTFLFSWIASIVNYAWENKFVWRRARKPVLVFLSVFAAIIIFGALKISSFMTPKTQMVKVASVVLLPENGEVIPMNEVYEKKLISPFKQTIDRINNLTATAVRNGARIVAFQEYAITINEDCEQQLQAACRKIAKNNNVYLSIAYACFANEGKGSNKSLLIDNDGNILVDYTKRYLLGIGDIGETRVFHKGAEIIQTVETPYGKIGVSLCRDMNFPSYIRQAAQQHVDIMLNPSYDNPKGLSPGYYQRSIEFGFSTIRPTYNGISHAEDYHGRILAQMDSDETDSGILYALVPVRGIKTLYGKTGDWLGWLSLILLISFSIPPVRKILI